MPRMSNTGNVPNQVSYRHTFEKLGVQLGYEQMEDWYNITLEDVHKHGGQELLANYNSIPSALQTAFPEHTWMFWKFLRVPHGYWKVTENQRKFVDWLGQKLEYKSLDDWYNVTQEDIHKHGGTRLLVGYYN